jgi:hypothetical protein
MWNAACRLDDREGGQNRYRAYISLYGAFQPNTHEIITKGNTASFHTKSVLLSVS